MISKRKAEKWSKKIEEEYFLRPFSSTSSEAPQEIDKLLPQQFTFPRVQLIFSIWQTSTSIETEYD